MKIPFLSFEKMNAAIKQDALQAFESFIDEGWYILGKRLQTFETEYAVFSETAYCAGVANGLDALVIALKTLSIGKGDEVIVPSNTYIASWLAVSAVGATPIPVEPLIETANINPAAIAAAITSRTKAIMPVHLYGQCCEMDAVMSIADKHGLYVVEDNAQAQGATYNGKKTGSFGHVNATSFYPGKNLGAYGDAGAITTNNEVLYNQACIIRNYGSSKKYYNQILGTNSRLDELQAGLLSLKLPYLNDWNIERNTIAKQYAKMLSGIADLQLPCIAANATSVFHLYVVRTSQRDALQKYLTDKGIGTLIHYPVPPHLQEAYRGLVYKKGQFPIAEQIANTCLSLPIYPGLQSEQIAYIAHTIESFFHG
ncbi:MAG: DegT/DnrJ/EryC1/StrS family aminotransferase [Bacteroidia bacterium]|jgi:dTDP-4-amino-4,6-dideoxygalactose transaminase|nr:DegT/DnrJ/EryC1/StrS family aminotransferase [Bacteroidia bacterium]